MKDINVKWVSTWQDAWHLIGMLLVVAGVVLLLVFIAAPKNVDYYYVSRGTSTTTNGICAYAHWTWHYDEVAFCSDDYQKVVDFVAKANTSRGK